MANIRGLITEYYPRIDAIDTEWVTGLFAEHAVYNRADATYNGIAEIRNFFLAERKIRGRHMIEGVWDDRDARMVFVTGRFDGFGVDGDARLVGFADVWQFDDCALVTRRQTYLALGHSYVER